MRDVTAMAEAYWASLRLTDEQRADRNLRTIIIDAYEAGYLAHSPH